MNRTLTRVGLPALGLAVVAALAAWTLARPGAGASASSAAAQKPVGTDPKVSGQAADIEVGSFNTLDGRSPDLRGYRPFPADNPWNRDISRETVHPNSDAFIAARGRGDNLKAEFGTTWRGNPNGIPFAVVTGDQPKVPIHYLPPGRLEVISDPGPYPIPPNVPVESRSTPPPPTDQRPDADQHLLVIDRDHERLYELYNAQSPDGGRSWLCVQSSIWDLKTGAPRPDGWASADAAGLPVFPGLVRYDEVVLRGEIRHALRMTLGVTDNTHVPPARAQAGAAGVPNTLPMGARLRLKADYDISRFSPANQVILKALKTYGAILADNGTDFAICGVPDMRWDDDDLHRLRTVPSAAFEVLDFGPGYKVTPPRVLAGPAGARSQEWTITLLPPLEKVIPERVVSVKPEDDAGGTFEPYALFLHEGQPSGTFRYIPKGPPGPRSIRFRDNHVGRRNPPPISFQVTPR